MFNPVCQIDGSCGSSIVKKVSPFTCTSVSCKTLITLTWWAAFFWFLGRKSWSAAFRKSPVASGCMDLFNVASAMMKQAFQLIQGNYFLSHILKQCSLKDKTWPTCLTSWGLWIAFGNIVWETDYLEDLICLSSGSSIRLNVHLKVVQHIQKIIKVIRLYNVSTSVTHISTYYVSFLTFWASQ